MLHDFNAWAMSLPPLNIPVQEVCERYEDLLCRTYEAWNTANRKIQGRWPHVRLPEFILKYWLRETTHELVTRVETPRTIEGVHNLYQLARKVEQVLSLSHMPEPLTQLIGCLERVVRNGPLLQLSEQLRAQSGLQYVPFPVHQPELEARDRCYWLPHWPRLEIGEYLKVIDFLFDSTELTPVEIDVLSRTIWHHDPLMEIHEGVHHADIIGIFCQRFPDSFRAIALGSDLPLVTLRPASDIVIEGPRWIENNKKPQAELYTFVRYLDDIHVQFVDHPKVHAQLFPEQTTLSTGVSAAKNEISHGAIPLVLSAADIARLMGVSIKTTSSRLTRIAGKSPDSRSLVGNPKSREHKYVYRMEMVWPLLQAMEKKRKHSGSSLQQD